MRICIDVSAAVHRRAGLGRYAQELTQALVAQAEHDYVAFYHQRGQAHLDPPIEEPVKIGAASQLLGGRIRLPAELEQMTLDNRKARAATGW